MTGQPYVSPVHEVKRLAREVGMEGKVRIINFGVRSQGSEVRQALDDCIHSGNWLLLQNYHLADEPDPPFFTMLKVGTKTNKQKRNRSRQKANKQTKMSIEDGQFQTLCHIIDTLYAYAVEVNISQK